MEEVKEIRSKEGKEQKESKIVKVVEIPTQTAEAFELEDGTVVSSTELLARLYNKISRIEKAVV